MQNPGIQEFIADKLPYLRTLKTHVIVNIAGKSLHEFEELAKRLDIEGITGIEVNVSCPNVEDGGIMFGKDPQLIEKITSLVKRSTSKAVIIKLTPETVDIESCARAAANGGADAISLINTVVGMAIDIRERKPFFKRVFAGLSGPAIKPIALAMVHRVSKAVNLPIIASGGIITGNDAIEFFMSGAAAVAIGTGNFIYPDCSIRVLNQIKHFLKENGYKSIREIGGISGE